MRNRVIPVVLLTAFLSAALMAQKRPVKRVSPAPAVTLQDLILQGRVQEAVKTAAKAPDTVPAAIKAVFEISDRDISEQRVSDAKSKLDALARFLDEQKKATKAKDVPREPLKGRQLRIQGIELNNQKEFAKAETVLRQALEISRTAGDEVLESGIRNNLGYSLLSLAEKNDLRADELLEAAAKEFDAARAMAEAQKDPLRAGSYNLNLGMALQQLRRFEPAMNAFKRAAANFSAAGKPSLEARAVLFEGIALGKVNAVSQEPLRLYEKARHAFEKAGEDGYAGWCLYMSADHLAYSQKFAEAAQAGERAVPFLTKAGNKDRLRACYMLLADMYERLGEKARAEKYRQLAQELGRAK